MKIMEDPYPSTPGEREKCLAEAYTFLKNAPDIPEELRAELLTHARDFIEARTRRAGSTTHFYGGQLGWTYWVVRNDNLDLVARLAPAAGVLATYCTVPGASWVPAAVASLFTALIVAKKIKEKVAILEERDYLLLMCLKQMKRATPEELAAHLNGTHIFGVHLWTGDSVAEVLQKLTEVAVGDGSVEKFVTRAADGQWSTNGI